MTNTSR